MNIYNLGDPEPVVVDGEMTEHGLEVERVRYNDGVKEVARMVADSIYKPLHKVYEKYRVSKVTVSVYPSKDEIFKTLGIDPYVGYKVDVDMSVLNEDGEWVNTMRVTTAG